ncbi:unnamed protein product [Heligmosomoides polygyrus]|uniref:Innexin n=1 Tax=Heligmosomoides polygyrus TaxID=6339 RepID=A0A183FBS5_HELPZ|nr:unnamed protein product [Heligmosomoides polygyrus]
MPVSRILSKNLNLTFQLVVSLSALDLKRWYAFQCYMKAMDVFDEDMHMDCDFVNPGEVGDGLRY